MAETSIIRWIWLTTAQDLKNREEAEIFPSEQSAIDAADDWCDGSPFTVHRVTIHPGKRYQKKLIELED